MQDAFGGGAVRVLLVEDQPVNQKVVTRMLERQGCAVALAEDGLVAVERAVEGWDLILMDCSMPRCDGFEAARRIRALGDPVARTPIVALTAHATPADRTRCLAAGMDEWITKPVAPAILASALERFTRWRPPTQAPLAEDVVDRRVVDELLVLAGPDDPGFLDGVLTDFRDTATHAIAQARTHFAAARFHDVRRTVHRLKSASATIGAVRLRETCARLEAATDGDLALSALAWLAVAESEVALASTALRTLLVAA